MKITIALFPKLSKRLRSEKQATTSKPTTKNEKRRRDTIASCDGSFYKTPLRYCRHSMRRAAITSEELQNDLLDLENAIFLENLKEYNLEWCRNKDQESYSWEENNLRWYIYEMKGEKRYRADTIGETLSAIRKRWKTKDLIKI